MRIYLTSTSENKERLCYLREWLAKQGHLVTSTWFDLEHPTEPPMEAAISLLELDGSDAVVEFTGPDKQVSSGASWECGYAYRAGKKLFYIGPVSNMFMERYGDTWPTSVPLEVTKC